jgi:hypothetical protein
MIITASIVGALALGTAGYFANEWRVCSNMQDDFLRAIEGFTGNVEAGALAGAIGVDIDQKRQKELRDMSLSLQEMQLTAIYERCGDDAGRSAAAMASDDLQESMKDVLSVP